MVNSANHPEDAQIHFFTGTYFLMPRELLGREIVELDLGCGCGSYTCELAKRFPERQILAADVMIGRAGSATCNEIAAAGVPCVLIPSPNVTNNHQEKNARVLEEAGGAVVVLEKDCNPEMMYKLVTELLEDAERRDRMTVALHSLVKSDSAQRICDIVEELAKN